MKSDKEWAKHIIKKFGKKEAYKWAIVYVSLCPCSFLGLKCSICKFHDKTLNYLYCNGCLEAKEYFLRVFADKSRVLTIKKMIEKKTVWYNRK